MNGMSQVENGKKVITNIKLSVITKFLWHID